MNILKTFKLNWRQVALFKVTLLSLGIILGVTFKDALQNYLNLFWILTIVCGLYVLSVWWKQ